MKEMLFLILLLLNIPGTAQSLNPGNQTHLPSSASPLVQAEETVPPNMIDRTRYTTKRSPATTMITTATFTFITTRGFTTPTTGTPPGPTQTPTSTTQNPPTQSNRNEGTEEIVPTGNDKTKSEEEKDKYPSGGEAVLLFTLIGINILLALSSLLLNSSVVAFYWSKSTSLVPMLYLRNGAVDLGYGCGILLQSVLLILVLTGADLPYASSILVLVGYFLTSLFVRLSVFLNCTLGVCRSINIVSPFYHVRKAWITAATATYALFWTAITAFDTYSFVSKRIFRLDLYLSKATSLKAEVGWSVLNSISYQTAALNGVNSVILFFVPFVLPALLCLVLMFLQVYHLKKSTGTTSNRPAITILIVTTIYVTTNLASLAAWLFVYRNFLGRSFKGLSWSELGVVYFSTVTCPLLCGTLTPLTLILRGKGCGMFFKLRNVVQQKPPSTVLLSMPPSTS